MIFICVGSRKFQFNRLLKKMDELVNSGDIQEEVFAQIGALTYVPQYYEFTPYLSSETFKTYQRKAHNTFAIMINPNRRGWCFKVRLRRSQWRI